MKRSSEEVGFPDRKVNFIQTDAAINPGNRCVALFWEVNSSDGPCLGPVPVYGRSLYKDGPCIRTVLGP